MTPARRLDPERLPPALGPGAPVERRSAEPTAALARSLTRGRRPVVVPGLAARWPATRGWAFGELAERVDDTEVLVERGNIMQHASRFESVRLRDYLLALAAGRLEDGGPFRYLASLDLFAHLPALAQDVDFRWFAAARPRQFVFAWLGPAGTVSGYHYDSPDNVVVMIRGRKLVHLVPPEGSAGLYPSDKWDYGAVLSGVDALAPDLERHPLFAGVEPASVVLEPGDALYIPHGWWHHIVSLEPAISVNCFGHTHTRFAWVEAREMGKALLHRLGLYADDCTCHHWVDGVRVPKPGKHPLV